MILQGCYSTLGPDPSAVTDAGMTVLHALYQPCGSCASGREQLATRLISVTDKSIVNTPDNSGATPLHYAAMSLDSAKGVSELITLGADPDNEDSNGAPISFYAELMGNTAASELLRGLAGDPTDVLDNQGKNKAEWVEAAKLKMDDLRFQLESGGNQK